LRSFSADLVMASGPPDSGEFPRRELKRYFFRLVVSLWARDSLATTHGTVGVTSVAVFRITVRSIVARLDILAPAIAEAGVKTYIVRA
jgi:hypothetical protein